MNCEQAQNLFDAYLDGELHGPLATEFAAHRLRCPTCRRELALLEVAGHVISSDTKSPLLSAEFTDRLLACAAQRPRQKTWRRRLLVIGGPLAAAACVALVVAIWSEQPKRAPQVLPKRQVVESTEELQRQVERALQQNPDNADLQRFAEALRQASSEIVEGTRESADLLQQTGREAILKLLQSLPVENPKAADAGAEAAGEEHVSPADGQ
jgi:hypothetical protein